MIVKKFLMIFLLVFCANNMLAQNELHNDIIYPDIGTKGTTSITYWNIYPDVGAVRLRFPPLDG